jgi:hypothetical protein
MKAFSRLLLSIATAGGAVAALSAPAHAVLQFSIGNGESSFGCVDNSPCDSASAVGVISIPSVSSPEFGVSASDIKLTSTGGTEAPAALDATIGSFSNTSDGALSGAFAFGDTDFSSAKQFRITASVTWKNAPGAEIDVAWFADPANQQGGTNPFVAPGNEIDFTEFDSPVSGSGTQTFVDTVVLRLSGPFSLTLQGDLLGFPSGGTVSATESVSAVPEASTWTMLIAGFAGLGMAGYRVSRKRGALAV